MAMANAYRQVPFSDITDLEIIGRGGFGLVYKANWQGSVIAVKGFFPNEEKELAELEKELTQTFRIKEHPHPNIIDIYGVSVERGNKYLLMEYAYGGSLQRVLFGSAKQEYTRRRAIIWMYQCAKGVGSLHAMEPKLLHRDLKPANLLLTDKNYITLKICDFGTVRELKTTMTGNKGSMAWTAPEVFGDGKYTEKCDVFSFSIILWEVFTRQEFYKRFHSIYAIPDYVRKGDRPELKDVWPDELKHLMTSCWHQNPSERPCMKDVVQEMGRLLAHHWFDEEPSVLVRYGNGIKDPKKSADDFYDFCSSNNSTNIPIEKEEQDPTDNFTGISDRDFLEEINEEEGASPPIEEAEQDPRENFMERSVRNVRREMAKAEGKVRRFLKKI